MDEDWNWIRVAFDLVIGPYIQSNNWMRIETLRKIIYRKAWTSHIQSNNWMRIEISVFLQLCLLSLFTSNLTIEWGLKYECATWCIQVRYLTSNLTTGWGLKSQWRTDIHWWWQTSNQKIGWGLKHWHIITYTFFLLPHIQLYNWMRIETPIKDRRVNFWLLTSNLEIGWGLKSWMLCTKS